MLDYPGCHLLLETLFPTRTLLPPNINSHVTPLSPPMVDTAQVHILTPCHSALISYGGHAQPIAAPLRGGWTPDSGDGRPSSWWLPQDLWVKRSTLRFPPGPPLPSSSPLSFFHSSVILCLPPPVFSDRGPAWQTGTRPFRRPFASSSFFSLFSSSAVPLLLISLLLLLAGINPHPGPYQLTSRDIERTRHRPSPLLCPPLWPPLQALSPASFTLSPLAYSPSVPLLPSPPLMPPANFTLSPLGASPTAPFWPSPPTLTQQSFNLSPLSFSPSGPIIPSPPSMSPASFTFSPFAFISAAPVRPSNPSLPQNSFSPSPTVIRRPGPPAPSPLLDPPPSLAACSQPALPAAGPALAPRSPSTAQFVQFNCNGIRSSRRELVTMLHSELRFALCRRQNSLQPPPPLPLPGTPATALEVGGGGGPGFSYPTGRPVLSPRHQSVLPR